MDHNFCRIVSALNRKKLLDGLVLLFALQVGMNRDDLSLVATAEKGLSFDDLVQIIRMSCVLGDDQHERFYNRLGL